jgi:GH24 family phage-related lysozyme (muramidase)
MSGSRNVMNHDTLKKQLILHEGLSLKPYKDSKGIWTCWVGRNVQRGLTTDELILLIQEGNSEKFADFIRE